MDKLRERRHSPGRSEKEAAELPLQIWRAALEEGQSLGQ